MIPLSGYLSRLWGTQRVYLISCTGFIVMSVLTGLSSSIDMMILTRALQGFIGGAMIPTVFAVAFTAFPPERRITASVIMGLIVTLAPTVGPTLGGHLTEWLSWRWLFFINVPTGVVVLFGVARWGQFDKGDPSLAKGFDWFGLAVMATFLMSMQFVLEEGSKDGWFEDSGILGLTVLAVVSGVVFIWRSLSYPNPIVELRAFANRNFSVGVAMTAVSGASLFGGTFLLPQFLGRVRHYSASEVGTTMVVSGLSMFATGPLAGRLVRQMDPRIPMCIGFMLAGFGMYMAHGVTKDWGFWQFAGVQACRGVGVMIAMIATQQVTMSTLPPQHGQERLRPGQSVAQHRRRHRPGAAGHDDHQPDGAVLYGPVGRDGSGRRPDRRHDGRPGRPHAAAGRRRSGRRGAQGDQRHAEPAGHGAGLRRQLHPAGLWLLRRRRRLAAGQAGQERPSPAFGRPLMPRVAHA
jgi:DHA2 family multidrug resistance protein